MRKNESFGSSDACDALKQLGESGFIRGLRPVTPRVKVSGRVMPLHINLSSSPKKSLREGISEACESSSKGDVVLICSDTADYSTLGGINALYVKLSGMAGAIVYGAVRDVSEMVKLKLPVFSLGIVPLASSGYVEVDSIGEKVTCGSVNVERGDYVVGDDDGVVIIRQSIEEEIIKRIAELKKKEKETVLGLRQKLLKTRQHYQQ